MNDIDVYTDGGARGNPGPAAAGIVFLNQGEIFYSDSHYLGETTNNDAEYRAVVQALSWMKENKNLFSALKTARFHMDSELVVKQLKGEYKIKHPPLQKHAAVIRTLVSDLSPVSVSFTHVPRAQNKEADRLVNECLDNHNG